jgi:hypothetical protein
MIGRRAADRDRPSRIETVDPDCAVFTSAISRLSLFEVRTLRGGAGVNETWAI